LIWIKDGSAEIGGNAPLVSQGSRAVPIESILVIVGILAVFALFSVVLAWVDRRTN